MDLDVNDQVSGYLHPLYAASFAEFGNPLELPGCGGWILERTIPGSEYKDAMGCYPLFCCQDWSLLSIDLARLAGKMVSLALVTDPFGEFCEDELNQSFDICYRYKEHFIADLSRPIEGIVSKSHQAASRRALNKVEVETCLNPVDYLEEWTFLYEFLVKRHEIQGIRRFSKSIFEKQMQVPGLVYFRVLNHGRIVGANLFFTQKDVVFGHLAAFTNEGYSLGAAYAVMWVAFRFFSDKASWIDLGAGAGLGPTRGDGLSKFKQGWSNGIRPVYFCGKILDRKAYSRLAEGLSSKSTYFPVYRTGEFV